VKRPTLLTAPWLRGPALVVREPLALIAVIAAALLLGLVAAGGPLFLSSVGAGALHAAADRRCTPDDQVSVINPALNVYLPTVAGPQPPSTVTAADPLVRRAFAAGDLPDPALTTYAVVSTGDTSGLRPADVGLFADPAALDHVELTARVDGPGVYLPDTYAEQLGITAGDELPLVSGALPVVGVYRDLDTASYRTVLPAFWCHWRPLIITSASSTPPPFVLTDPGTLAAVAPSVQAEWTSPVDVGQLTVTEAQAVVGAAAGLFPAADVDQENTGSPVAGFGVVTQLDVDLSQTGKVRDAVASPVTALTVAGGAVALVVVGGSVLFWAQRRRTELRLLSSRGVSPPMLGLKAAAELGLPAAAGCLLGWAAALLVVPRLGPSALLEPGAPSAGLVAVAAAWAGCLLTIVAVGAVSTAELRPRRTPRLLHTGLAAAVLAPIAAAVWLGRETDLQQLARVVVIDPAVLLAPVLAVIGFVLAAALLVVAPLQRARQPARARGFAVFAAVNRAAAARGPLLAVICGLAIPIALALYSAGFTAANETTIAAKADTYTGAGVVLDVRVGLGELPDAGADATPIVHATGSGLDATGDRTGDVQVLGIDPATFGHYALFDPDLSGSTLPRLLDRLTPPADGGPAPALLIGAGDDATVPSAVRLRASTLALAVTGTAPAFPGMRHPGQPVLVVDLDTLTGLDRFAGWTSELWTDQQHAPAVLDALSATGVLTDDVVQPEAFIDATTLLPVTWTFDFLRALSSLVSGLSTAGLLLFLAARQQRQETSYVMLRRMGMTVRAHQRSLLIEIGALSAWAWLAGCATGAAALAVATTRIDVNPAFPPPTLLVLPVAVPLAAGLALAVATVALTWWTTRRAEHADPDVVLRS
jgi:putative ABC transport system permease protein